MVPLLVSAVQLEMKNPECFVSRGGWQTRIRNTVLFDLRAHLQIIRGKGSPFLRNQAFAAEVVMHFTAAHISPIVALVAGILILIAPRLLNYVVAIYLIVVGLVGLNGIYHFMK